MHRAHGIGSGIQLADMIFWPFWRSRFAPRNSGRWTDVLVWSHSFTEQLNRIWNVTADSHLDDPSGRSPFAGTASS